MQVTIEICRFRVPDSGIQVINSNNPATVTRMVWQLIRFQLPTELMFDVNQLPGKLDYIYKVKFLYNSMTLKRTIFSHDFLLKLMSWGNPIQVDTTLN